MPANLGARLKSLNLITTKEIVVSFFKNLIFSSDANHHRNTRFTPVCSFRTLSLPEPADVAEAGRGRQPEPTRCTPQAPEVRHWEGGWSWRLPSAQLAGAEWKCLGPQVGPTRHTPRHTCPGAQQASSEAGEFSSKRAVPTTTDGGLLVN